jgi:hypothetical protein
MDITVVDDKGKPVEVSEVPVKDTVDALQGSQPNEMDQRAIGQVLGIENESEFSKYQLNLKTLVDYAKTQTTDHSPENLKWVIRSLEVKLGTPPFAEDRVKFITRYVWLLSEGKKIEEERKKFEKI